MKSWLLLISCAVLTLPTLSVAQGPNNAQIIAWAQQNRPIWEKLQAEARRKGPRPIPVPPQIDPPCHLCGDDTKTQNELQVDAWVKEAMQPEFGQATQIVQIAKQAELYRSAKGVNNAALSALSYLPDDKGGLDAAAELINRYLDMRAFPMAEKYKGEPKRAYAGITLVTRATREYGLLGGNSDSKEQQAIQYVDAWLESVQAKAETDVLGGKQYNLCPVYVSILRQLELASASAVVTDADFERLKKTLDKMDRMLHFKVAMTLKVHDVNESGTKTDITWTGSARMRIKLGSQCYTPEWEDGNSMSVKVENWSIVGADGTPVELESARNFQAPLKPPMLNLCEPNPVLQVPFDIRNMPVEETSVKGYAARGAYFQGMLAGLVGANNAGPAAANLTGRGDKGPATLNAPDPNANPETSDAMKELQAHQGDQSWFMSAEGQAVLRKVQQQAMARAHGALARRNNAAANAHTAQDAVASLLAAQMHWKNGSADVAGDNWHVTQDNALITLEMNVTNDPQK